MHNSRYCIGGKWLHTLGELKRARSLERHASRLANLPEPECPALLRLYRLDAVVVGAEVEEDAEEAEIAAAVDWRNLSRLLR